MTKYFAALLLTLVSHYTLAVGQGDIAPSWTGTDLITGETVTFPDVLNGKPAVVLFWATWCPYCKAFMPRAAEIQAQYAEQGVQIISLNHKERGYGDAAAYARSLGFPLIAIADADSIGDAWGIDFIPGLMVIAADGTVAYRRRSTSLPAGQKVSQMWAAEVRASLDKLLRSNAADSIAGGKIAEDMDQRGCIAARGEAWCERTQRCENAAELAASRDFTNTRAAFKAYCDSAAER